MGAHARDSLNRIAPSVASVARETERPAMSRAVFRLDGENRAPPRCLSASSAGWLADGAGPHLWFLAVYERHRTQRERGIGKRDSQRHGVAGDAPGKSSGMPDTAVQRVRVDVVSPRRFESATGIWAYRAARFAEGAPDVDMSRGVGCDQARVITAPGACDIRDLGSWG